MMKQKLFFFLRIPVLSIALVLATAAATVFHALRNFWVFYNPFMAFLGGSTGVFLLSLIVIALLLGLLALRLYVPIFRGKEVVQSRLLRILAAVALVFAVVLAAGSFGILFLSGGEVFAFFSDTLKKDIVPVLLFIAAAVGLLVLPKLRGKAKAITAIAMAVLMGLWGLWMVFPLQPYSFVGDPVVMDTGKEYAVVFATSDTGTGYVQYSFGGKDYTVYAQKHGRRIANRLIHTVCVPYEQLKNNAYQIGSTRVIEDYSYGSRTGKSIHAGPYTLRVNEGQTQSYLCISDWHSHIDKAKQAIAQLGEYDALVMLGDPNTGMHYEEQAVRYIVQFGGDITHGEMPVIYARGNHETRGAFASSLPEYLGYEALYYTVQRGAYSFLVLDSGEDKPDDHIEYGGMDDYALERTAMLRWLQEKPQTTDKLIVLSHAWQISEPEPEVSRAAWDVLQQMGARFMISGHLHFCKFLDQEDDGAAAYLKAYPGIATYIDGGYAQKTYIASKLTLTPQGVHFEASTNTGEKVMDNTLLWESEKQASQ